MGLPTAPGLASVPVPNLTSSAFFTASIATNPSIILGQQDSNGAMWMLNDIQGYFMSPPIVTATSQLGFNDRMAAITKFPRAGRTMTLVGTCFAQTYVDLFAARQRLMGAWGDPNTAFTLVVTEPDVPKQLTQCRLNGQIDVSWMTGTPLGGWYEFNYSIPVIALDAAKYSIAPNTGSAPPYQIGNFFIQFPLTFPLTTNVPSTQPAFDFQQSASPTGYVVINNIGNLEAYPLITITGSVNQGWYIENATTENQFSVDLAIPLGSTLVVDMLNNLAYMNGVLVNSQVQGNWFDCPAGLNTIQFIASVSSGAVMQVQCYSAWR